MVYSASKQRWNAFVARNILKLKTPGKVKHAFDKKTLFRLFFELVRGRQSYVKVNNL